jgi:hypothetical protein
MKTLIIMMLVLTGMLSMFSLGRITAMNDLRKSQKTELSKISSTVFSLDRELRQHYDSHPSLWVSSSKRNIK